MLPTSAWAGTFVEARDRIAIAQRRIAELKKPFVGGEMESQEQKRRGKSADTLLTQALEDLNRYEHETPVDMLKVQAAKTRIIALGKRVTAKQKNKKADKIATLLKTLEDKVAALTTEVEGLKQRLAGPVVPQADPAVATLAKMMADSTDASVDNSTGSPTLERMRRGEQVGGGPPRVPDIYPTLPKPVPPTPPRVKPVESQPVPPAPAPDTLDAKVARIQEESRRNAPAPSKVAAYEATEKLLADLQRATSDGYQQTLAVEAVFPAKSAEEQAAMDLMEMRYSPEAIESRTRAAIQASIADAQKANEPHPEPTSPTIQAIEAEIAFENNVKRLKEELDERLAKRQAQATEGE